MKKYKPLEIQTFKDDKLVKIPAYETEAEKNYQKRDFYKEPIEKERKYTGTAFGSEEFTNRMKRREVIKDWFTICALGAAIGFFISSLILKNVWK